jgi:hypothetical protein
MHHWKKDDSMNGDRLKGKSVDGTPKNTRWPEAA